MDLRKCFENKSLWLPTGNTHVTNGNAIEPDLSSGKKQTIEVPIADVIYNSLAKDDNNSQVKESGNILLTPIGHDVSTSANQTNIIGGEIPFVPIVEQAHGKGVENAPIMGTSSDIRLANDVAEKTRFRTKKDAKLYKDLMNALSRPVSSYALLYELPPSGRKSKTPANGIMSRFWGPNSKSKSKLKAKSKSAFKKKSEREAAMKKSEKEAAMKRSEKEAVMKKSEKEAAMKRSEKEAAMKKFEKEAAMKKAPNRFLSNVKSLTVTGMLDKVPVRYVSSSGKELGGIIKGPSYLCGCSTCNFSKEVNAYEFERHAGFKTSHPNNHIRFENGKTIHQIVQELKKTSDNMLFDAIQTLTGSTIDKNAFILWRESFNGAIRKLEPVSVMEQPNL